MARKKGSVPAYRRHKGSGRGYVSIQGRQDLFPGQFNSDESLCAYRRFVSRWVEHGGDPPPDEPADTTVYTVASLFDEYEAHLKTKHPPEWIRNNLARIQLSLKATKSLFGDQPAESVTPLCLQQVRADMLAGKKLCRREINSRVFAIRKAFKWAVAQEKVPPDLAPGLSTVESLREGEFGSHVTLLRFGGHAGLMARATLPRQQPPLGFILVALGLVGRRAPHPALSSRSHARSALG